MTKPKNINKAQKTLFSHSPFTPDSIEHRIETGDNDGWHNSKIHVSYKDAYEIGDYNNSKLYVYLPERFASDARWEIAIAYLSEMNQKFYGDEKIHIPEIYWNFSPKRLITNFFDDGVQIYETDEIINLSLDTKASSINLATICLTDGFFHADLHPKNIFITKDGKISLIDFGIMAISDQNKFAIAEILYKEIHQNDRGGFWEVLDNEASHNDIERIVTNSDEVVPMHDCTTFDLLGVTRNVFIDV